MLNKNFAATSTMIGNAPKLTVQQPHFTKQEDWGQIMSKFLTDYKNQENEKALVSAIEGGDPQAIDAAFAKYNPQAAMQQRLSQMAEQRQFERQKELLALKNATKGNDNATSASKNYEYLVGQGMEPRKALAIAFGGNTEAVGGALAGSGFEGLGAAGYKEYDKQRGKNLAAREKEARAATEEYNKVTSDVDRIIQLLPEAQTATLVDRNIPTMFLAEPVQKARGELRNILSGLRLDQMQYMKGAISDKEQEFLNAAVSGDFTKFTPAEIVGTMHSIRRKAANIKDKFSQSTAIPQQDDDPLGLR